MTDPRHPFEISHGFCDYPFPLKDGQLAHLLIPNNGRLEPDDAERLIEVIQTLVVSGGTTT